MLIRTLLAATALTAPMAANAQSIPGMDMGQHEHHAPAPIEAADAECSKLASIKAPRDMTDKFLTTIVLRTGKPT